DHPKLEAPFVQEGHVGPGDRHGGPDAAFPYKEEWVRKSPVRGKPNEIRGPMRPGRVRTRGANMILTTRTIGLLVTMAVVTGGAAWGVHALIASAADAGSDYGLDTTGNGKFEWLVVEAQVSVPAAGTWEIYADLSTDKAPATGACGI